MNWKKSVSGGGVSRSYGLIPRIHGTMHGTPVPRVEQNNAAPSHENPTNFVRNGTPVGPQQGYSCQLVAKEAIRWMNELRDKSKPFFQFVCFHEPHEPIASPSELDNIAPRGETADDEFAQMLAAAERGDSKARAVLASAARALAIGLGNAISLLNPERIILGGRFPEAGDSLLALLRQALPQYALPELVANVDVRMAELGEDSAFLGIAAHIRSRLFAYPSMGGTVDERPVKRRSTTAKSGNQ